MAYQEHYTQQLLDSLRAKLLIMGSKTQQALDDAAIAVLNHDLPRAAAVLDGDTDIDDLENEIDEATLNILARTQPVARDLRFLMSVVRMVLDLERIGDQAEDIAEIVISGQVNEGEELLRDMAASTIKMVTESVDAYVKHDTMLAEKVIAEDDIVDDWFDRVKHTLIRRMTTDPGEGERAVDLLMIAKYFERIGDHAVNVAQWVIFSVTGMHKEG